jgi:hypothetical protein
VSAPYVRVDDAFAAHPHPAGPRVRLRLARPGDRAAVLALLAGRGVEASELDVRRLLAFDPLGRLVLCAFAPVDGAETLVGLGAIDLAPGAEPDTVVVDERLTEGLGELLAQVLSDRAAARRAA